MAIRRTLNRYFGEEVFNWFDRSYVLDWVSQVFERSFTPNDPAINYPHKHNHGLNLNHSIALYLPILLIAVVGTIRKSLILIHHGTISVCASRGVAKLITEFFKHKVGRLRPDFLARCKWNETLTTCTGKANDILDGRKSFPSGHSSTAFAGMMFLSLWIAGQTAAWKFSSTRRPRSLRSSHLASFFLTLFPLFWASFVAVTRIEDYRHHKEDVIVGSVIGIISGIVCYVIFWPSPFSSRIPPADLAHPRVIYMEDSRWQNAEGFELTRVKDDDLDPDVV
ncbi:lipid phosphate phosphatase 1 [Cyathus striatus]|nr:lipid phosphate phosphatase 1 [Cyathus striatus]